MKSVLIVGLPFFPYKYNYLVRSYLRQGVDVKVLLNTSSNCFTSDSQFRDMFEFSGSGRIGRVSSYFRVIKEFKPKNIDCYDYSVFTLFYVIIASLFKIHVRLWLIGGELLGDRQNLNDHSFILECYIVIKKLLTRFSLRFVDVIYAKELHHLETIKKINPKLLKRVVKIYNCVPVNEQLEVRLPDRDFLYANAVIEKRNVIDLIRSFYELKKQGISFSASIYGFNSISNEVYAARGSSYSEKALAEYRKYELEDNVKVYGFVSDIREKMLSYKFFILPADIILANYSLLEAMSFGLVPIVYPGDGYEEIVEDGINGLVVKNGDLAGTLKHALSLTDAEYSMMSKSAHEKIKNDFSLDLWENKISDNLS